MHSVQTKTAYDQMGFEVNIPRNPRIISLVPSQTELLFDLGLNDQIFGVTKFCIHPKHLIHEKAIVGGTKNFRFDTIKSLKPDLIIGNKEENYSEGINKLKEDYPVWMSDIVSLDDAYSMMLSIGDITDRSNEAETIVADIQKGFASINKYSSRKVLYLIWQNPFMAVASNTFIDEIFRELNLTNVAADLSRYPELTVEEIQLMEPEVIMLSSEPYPFKQKHVNEYQQMFPSARVMLVDGEMFSWYGSRMLKAIDYFDSLDL